jgi:cell division protein FtsI (penicillin-binding protein 3)
VRLASPARRLRILLVLVCMLLSFFGARLVQLQGVDAAAYAAEATRLTTVTLPATRGSITDRAGKPLATTVEARDVTADQTLVTDPAAEAAALAPVLGVDAATIATRLTGTSRFVYVAKQVTPATWAAIAALDLPGIYSQKTSKRVYPGGTLAANVLGFVGVDPEVANGISYVGRGGLELALQDVLAGRDGSQTYESAGGAAIPTGQRSIVDPVPGRDVTLTIDRDIQWYTQQALAAQVKATGAEEGYAVVMDPRTGEVLALATAPTFDPNDPGKSPAEARGNHALSVPYEPGSTGKLITAAALLEEGVVDLGTRFTVPNRLQRAGKNFKDFEDRGKPEQLTYAGTIARSSNIGTILAAEKLGDLRRLYPYFQKFGIGEKLGLGFPAATPGRLLSPKSWSSTTPYTMVFGQSYSVNAVQMASMVATIANGGVRVAPSLVKQYVAPDGTVSPAPAPAKTRVVSEHTAKEVTLAMEAVVNKGGTAPSARIPGYRVAGKTGTAQRYNDECRCYRGYTMSFIGFAPADKPSLVVAVTLQNPGGTGGGSTAGPVFHDVMSFALQALRVPPTGSPAPVVPIYWP